MAILKVLNGQAPGQEIPLDGAHSVLGRHPNCQVKLEDASVSREHARITRAGDHFYIEDLNSRNGTFVNGQLVTGRRRLTHDDHIKICDLLFLFEQRAPSLVGTTVARPNELAMLVDEPDTGSSTIMTKLDVSSSQSGLRVTVRPEAKLRALMEITENLGKALSLDQVLQKTLDTLFRIFVQADRGFVAIREHEGDRLQVRAVKHRRGDGETIRISRTIVDQVMARKEAVISADAASDERFDMSQSIADFRIRSMMCVPLVTSENSVLGVIQIDTIDQRSRFQQDDLELLAAVARQAAFAVELAQLHETALRQQRIEYDLTLAHQVQQGFLPATSPEIEGYTFFDYYEPANELGGDYYDYVTLPGDRLAVIVADVSGKGVAASLLMARLSSEVRFMLASESSPARAVERLNANFARQGWEDRFVTLVLIVLEQATHEVTVVNAGHMPPLLRRKNAAVEPVGADLGGWPLGVDPSTSYKQLQFSLARGEALVLFTDGVSEALNSNSETYGLSRLESCLARRATNVGALGQGVLDDVTKFVAGHPQSDDICLLCLGRQ